MPEDSTPYRYDDHNPPEDILANLTRMTELRLSVGTDLTLGCITVDVEGLQGEPASLIMAKNHALELANRLLQHCMRLARAQREEDLGPPDLGPGSFGSTF